jgi:ABC-2 type transport system ATP-binding protein
LLERFAIADVAGRRAALFSGGMRRRLDLAMTLVGDPRVIFLDEPTTGLDPRSRRTMWETVRELVAGGTTVFLTTQYLEEADQLADRIAVLDGGRIVAEGTADELKARIPGSHVRLRFTAPADYERAASVFPDATRDDEQLALRVAGDGGLDALRALLDRLDGAGAHAAGFSVHTPDLDDVFLALTGEGAKETTR